MGYFGKDQDRDRYADEFMQGMSTIEIWQALVRTLPTLGSTNKRKANEAPDI